MMVSQGSSSWEFTYQHRHTGKPSTETKITMGAAYNILGKLVPPHYLAIGTILTVVGGVQLATLGGDKESAPAAAPKAPATSSSKDGELDVEKAIADFLASNEKA
ncbi:uncharacterized protein C5L36_0A08200 [Pichia kudriavzevii]|uniref:ATP synthase subunit K, mitochondrial n=2 Tax=Pichia kudriavzevii TaxID=4909 RepID=A0A2U9QYV8_PICKU|nr:uncharacterized protein C5L36_0A08200 [Pichia kudriavzevii]AWU74222.1 hypothetical protein C5L36_0A08200 [Pichia kudriavzevii]